MIKLLSNIVSWTKKLVKGAIRAVVGFFVFIFGEISFHVLRTYCRIRDFFLELVDLVVTIFRFFVLDPIIFIGWCIKELAILMYPYVWAVIFCEILILCFGERLRLFIAGISWKKLRVQNFEIFLKIKKFWTDLLKRFLAGTPWKRGT